MGRNTDDRQKAGHKSKVASHKGAKEHKCRFQTYLAKFPTRWHKLCEKKNHVIREVVETTKTIFKLFIRASYNALIGSNPQFVFLRKMQNFNKTLHI